MRFPLLALLSALLWLLPLDLFATADELTVEHVTSSQYRIGDIVTVADADGEEFPLKIVRIDHATGQADFLDQAGQSIRFPVDRIRAIAGKWFRFKSWALNTTQGNWSVGALATALAAVGAQQTLDVSEKDDENRVDAATAAAQAEAAAAQAGRSTAEQGPSDGAGFFISGTFTGSTVYVATGSYTPSITFAVPSGPSGGRIAQVNVAPDAAGQAQEQRDVGEWSSVSRTEISLKGLPEIYAGTATVQGITPYGSAVYKTATLVLRNGLTLQGGQVVEANPPQQVQP